MYQIYAGGAPVYAPGGDNFIALKPVYQQELNKAGRVTFTLLPTSYAYDSVAKLSTPVTVIRDGVEIFFGRVLSVEKDFYNRKAVVCEGALAFLNDVILQPFEFTDASADCVKNYIKYILARYNAGVESWKHIECGNVTVTDSNNYLYRHKDTYANAYDVLTDHTIESTLSGYLSIRRDDGVTYLDYTAQSGEQSVQYIEYGKNLLDLTEHATAEDVFTVLIPLGKKEDETVTIETVNDGRYYIESAEGIAKYGKIWAVKTYDGITTPEALLRTARADLAVGVQENVSLELSAVDLSSIGIDTEAFKCGDYVPVYSAPHGISTYFVCNKTTLALDAPEDSTYQMGAAQAGLIDQQLGYIKSSGNAVAMAEEAQAVAQGAVQIAGQTAESAEEALNTAQNAVQIAGQSTETADALGARVTALEAHKYAYGTASAEVLAGAYTDSAVAFETEFPASPCVILQSRTEGAEIIVTASSATGFTARLKNLGAVDATITYTWLALV